ncbi:hypothetical protein GH733_015269 [Mirounga leonina]|nr:hypothetical protein GH733_015269 [Mirounga leonina]
MAEIAYSWSQLNPRLLPAFPGQGIFSLTQLPARELPPSWRRTTPVLILALEESLNTCWAMTLLFLRFPTSRTRRGSFSSSLHEEPSEAVVQPPRKDGAGRQRD